MGRREKKRRPPAEKRPGSIDDDGGFRDELLASLIAGTLGPIQRAEAARFLAASPDAREILQMAYQALVSGRHKPQ